MLFHSRYDLQIGGQNGPKKGPNSWILGCSDPGSLWTSFWTQKSPISGSGRAQTWPGSYLTPPVSPKRAKWTSKSGQKWHILEQKTDLLLGPILDPIFSLLLAIRKSWLAGKGVPRARGHTWPSAMVCLGVKIDRFLDPLFYPPEAPAGAGCSLARTRGNHACADRSA